MMDETIIVRNLEDTDVGAPMKRSKFYKEQIEVFKKTGKPTKSVDTISVLLFNEVGEVFIQKRSKHKKHNPYLLDKSLGGHMKYGDTVEYTTMVETVQELQVPSIVLKSNKDFIKTFTLLKNYLNTVALIKHIDTKLVLSKKIFDKKKITIASYNHVLLGVYLGRTKTIDREATGVLHYTVKDLEVEMESMPNLFTDDLQKLLSEYKTEIQKFQEEVNLK